MDTFGSIMSQIQNVTSKEAVEKIENDLKDWKRDTLESIEAFSKGEIERLLDGMRDWANKYGTDGSGEQRTACEACDDGSLHSRRNTAERLVNGLK